MFPLTK